MKHFQHRNVRRIVCALAILITAITAGLVSPAPLVKAASENCQEVSRSVASAPGTSPNLTVRGTLCVPSDYAGQPTADILVHGATYNRSYWDWPTDHPQYSYVDRTLDAGRATFAYDRLGAGQSSRPLSPTITVETDAFILHQLIEWLKTGQSFDKVNVIGHSFGSIVGISETAAYNDADKLVLTGGLHAQGSGQTLALTKLYPAALDPKFAGQILDPGYLTTIPGSRDDLFYSSLSEPAVIAADEAMKDVISSGQFQSGFTQIQTPAPLNIAKNITIPVQVVVGTEDILFCGGLVDCNNHAAVQANEAPYYARAPQLQIDLINGTGHNLTLHTTADTTFDHINGWLTQ